MSITRGNFLKSLGKSLPGMILGSGAAAAAKKVLGKMAAASGTLETPASGSDPKPAIAKPRWENMILRGPTGGNRVALTFDDGPTPGVTDRILDELKQRGLHATFFMIGERVAAAPDLARRVLAEGHDVANHTNTHPKLSDLSNAQAAREIQQAQDIFVEVLNHRPEWFRPPYGELRADQTQLVHDLGMRIVMWSVDPRDWSQPGEDQILSCILRDTTAGSIILCHDKYAQNANATGPVLDGLLAREFKLVSLSTLMD
jgi:peptidoglycan/xylan/chitin deacetylase (PgdA/CDA1 family)